MTKPHTEISAPPFKAISAVGVEKETGNLKIQFEAADGRFFGITLQPSVIPFTIAALASQGQQAGADGRGMSSQALRVVGWRPLVGKDGAPGFAWIMDGGLKVPMVFPQEALPALRSAIVELERLSAPAPPDGAPKQ
jgi:hypothetical protein